MRAHVHIMSKNNVVNDISALLSNTEIYNKFTFFVENILQILIEKILKTQALNNLSRSFPIGQRFEVKY